MKKCALAIAFIITSIIAGCSKTTNPVSSDRKSKVNLSVKFSKAHKGTSAVDSLVIDSAVVVFERIKFESHIDTALADDGEGNSDEEDDLNITFRGPFVVRVRDTVSIDFASQTLPAGTYDGIKFKIHRLKTGEHHEDSDDYNNESSSGADDPYESSIVVWGSTLKEGTWTPFEFDFDGEFEFKMKGNFVVEDEVSTVNIVLNFNMGDWFINPDTGAYLDPADLGRTTRELFKRAIKNSFRQGRGGRDHDHDGHPDDDEEGHDDGDHDD